MPSTRHKPVDSLEECLGNGPQKRISEMRIQSYHCNSTYGVLQDAFDLGGEDHPFFVLAEIKGVFMPNRSREKKRIPFFYRK